MIGLGNKDSFSLAITKGCHHLLSPRCSRLSDFQWRKGSGIHARKHSVLLPLILKEDVIQMDEIIFLRD